LLRQESFDMILVHNPSCYDGGVTTFVWHPTKKFGVKK
jgi:hypothetical protein